MSSLYVVLAVLVVFTQRLHASYEHMHGFEEYPIAEHVPVVAAHAPVIAAPVAAAAPVVAAAAPLYPYGLHDHYHSPAQVRNLVGSYHRETGHMSDTDMLIPFKARRRAALRAARMRKNLHKKKH
ncbi:hypothetical protein Y032_0011g1349 [Ancylostoma ceylanicum]|uniref:Uncharacterized protein n=1 Tax=Ancylostoma ceylanicum TaxID=53326 RepID=A0A016VEJ8_9BILA|nr:hypothetical protein Y032_0011g1349 [Ancylostoma ceylanicum]